jgi:hypothetical protein
MENQLVVCNECKQTKTNIKRYRLFDTIVFVVFAARHESSVYTCCSECMREKIIKKTFNYNIFTAWALWLILMLPWHSFAYLLTYTNGHSRAIRKILKK